MVLIGKMYANAKLMDVGGSITCLRYYAGWADKVQGKTIEVDPKPGGVQAMITHNR